MPKALVYPPPFWSCCRPTISLSLLKMSLLTMLTACGSDSEAGGNTPVTAAPVEGSSAAPNESTVNEPVNDAPTLRSVVFARELDEDWQPVGGPVSTFSATEHEVHARVTIAGRPRSGKITLRWMWRELDIVSSEVDLADVNGGVLFSYGEDTFLRARMTTPQLYIGNGHRLLVLFDERVLGEYSFVVAPPEGASPSRFVDAALHGVDPRDADLDAARTTFTTQQTVFVVGHVALGEASWFNAFFIVDGTRSDALTREVIGVAGASDVRGFVFSALPNGGWPVGRHRVQLVLDDSEVAELSFDVIQE